MIYFNSQFLLKRCSTVIWEEWIRTLAKASLHSRVNIVYIRLSFQREKSTTSLLVELLPEWRTPTSSSFYITLAMSLLVPRVCSRFLTSLLLATNLLVLAMCFCYWSQFFSCFLMLILSPTSHSMSFIIFLSKLKLIRLEFMGSAEIGLVIGSIVLR